MRSSRLVLVALLMPVIALAACGSAQTPGAVSLSSGNYTPLGGVQKNNQPTASDIADLQAAENGKLGVPALVEFYADY